MLTLPIKLALTAGVATTLLTPTTPAQADPCGGGDGTVGCGIGGGGGSTGGGGGVPGGGGGSDAGGGGVGDIPEVPGGNIIGGGDGDGGGGGGGGRQAPPPATIDLAEQARASANLPAPRAHTSPSRKTYVRLRTRLWVENFVPVATDPITVGAQTVQATAIPASVIWNLGETTMNCNSPGSRNSTACSYIYRRSSVGAPGGLYQIIATITWKVHWTCTGVDCDAPGGDLADLALPSTPEPLEVGEIQANSRP